MLSGLSSLLILTREAGKCLLDLTLYVFVGDYSLLRLLTLTLCLAPCLLSIAGGLCIAVSSTAIGVCGATRAISATGTLSLLLRCIVRDLGGFCLDVYRPLTDAGTLTTALVTMCLLGRTGIVVDGGEIDLTDYIEANPCAGSRRAVDLRLTHGRLFLLGHLSFGCWRRLGLNLDLGLRLGGRLRLRFGLCRLRLFDLSWCRSFGWLSLGLRLRSGNCLRFGLGFGLNLDLRLGLNLCLGLEVCDRTLDIEARTAILRDHGLDVGLLSGATLWLGLFLGLGRLGLGSSC